MNLELTDKEKAALRAEFCKGFTDEQAEACFTFCRVRNLLPGKHVLFQLRRSKEWDEVVGAKVDVTKIVFITTIDASRLIAQRTGQYGGPAPEQYIYLDDNGIPSLVSEIPLPKLPLVPGQTPLPREPWAVKTTVFRKDFDHPVSSVARFDAYASTYKTNNGPGLTEMWVKRGPEQLAKCSEMLSLRRAFPEELGGLYIAEEFKSENEEAPVTPASVTVSTPVSVPPSAPKVNQTPATATETPRPGEAKTEYHVTEVPATLPPHSGDTLKVVPKDEAKAEALKAVPDLKPASELPAPKKNGRPKKNDRIPPAEGITDEDLAVIGTPPPEPIDREANQKESQEFVESLDPTPTKEEQAGFTKRVRALAEAGAANPDLRNYILNVGKKDDPKQLTVRDWKTALDQLEAILAESKEKLKEVTKAAPLPKF
jgi:hypothetical protein